MRVVTSSGDELYAHTIGWSGGSLNFTPSFCCVIFSTAIIEGKNTKGILVDSDKIAHEERMCSHYHLEGDILAVKEGFIDYKVENLPLYYRGTDNYNFSTTTFRDSLNRVSRSWGPVSVNDLPRSQLIRFPDTKAGKRKNLYRDCWIAIATQGNVVTITAHDVQVPAPYTGEGRETLMVMAKVEIDLKSRRWRDRKTATPGPWNSFVKLKPLFAVATDTPALRLPSFSSLESYRNFEERLRRRYLVHDSSLIYGDLVRRCANDARVVQTNSIELIGEIATIATTLKETVSLLGGKVNPKLLGKAWLSYKYGLRLTHLGIKTAIEGLSKRVMSMDQEFSRSRAMERNVYSPVVGETGSLEVQHNYKIIYHKYSTGSRQFFRNWFDSGLFPSLTNAWDLIPLTFVLDWFLKVESHLDGIDANTYWSLYDISLVVFTEKRTYHDVATMFPTPGLTLVGDCTLICYNRQVTTSVHSPLYFDPSPHNFKNYAELASLIVVTGK